MRLLRAALLCLLGACVPSKPPRPAVTPRSELAAPASRPATSSSPRTLVAPSPTAPKAYGKGVELIVQREVALRLRAEGPIIGRALPGAKLLVHAWGAPLVEVRVRGFRGIRTDPHEPGRFGVPLRALVPASALGPAAARPSSRPARGEERRAGDVVLLARAGDWLTAFAELNCGAVQIVEERRRAGALVQRVVQQVGGVELEGFAHQPIGNARAHGCPRTVPPPEKGAASARPPAGFIRVADPKRVGPFLQGLVRGRRPLFLPVQGAYVGARAEGVTCADYRFERRGRGLALVHRWREPGCECRSELRLELWGTSLELEGPTGSCRGHCEGRRASAACIDYREVVDRDPHSLITVTSIPPGPGHQEIWAYHPEDADPWFLDRAACERWLGQHPGESLVCR